MSKARLRAEAINRFVTDAKAVGVFPALKAACIMTGWDTLAGALTPLVGSAPTNNGFLATDYDRGIGITGRSTNYIDSNFNTNLLASPSNHHISLWLSSKNTVPGTTYAVYNYDPGAGYGSGWSYMRDSETIQVIRCNSSTTFNVSGRPTSGKLYACKRDASTQYARVNGSEYSAASTALAGTSYDYSVFGLGPTANVTFACPWYSFGSSVDLAALDTLVTRLMADLRAIEEDGMDRDSLRYVRAVEAADGSFMTTGVKNAVDRLVKGLKYDKDANGRSAWDAIGASCLLCGPRTIAGALVPLKGAAPTAQGGWTSSDYNQETGLKGNGSTLYLDTNRANNADGQNDNHNAVYLGAAYANGATFEIAAGTGTGSNSINVASTVFTQNRDATEISTGLASSGAGFVGLSRSNSSGYSVRAFNGSYSAAAPSDGVAAGNVFVFGGNSGGSPIALSSARLAFYSVGASLSLSALDSRITKYVSDVAAAIP